jgi:hypothetical protein
LCISICRKDEPLCTSLLNCLFTTSSIISVKETNTSRSGTTYLKVSGSFHIPQHLQEEFRVIVVEIETIFARKSHDDGSTKYFSSGSSHSHSPFTFTNHIVLLTPHWNYFLNWE